MKKVCHDIYYKHRNGTIIDHITVICKKSLKIKLYRTKTILNINKSKYISIKSHQKGLQSNIKLKS